MANSMLSGYREQGAVQKRVRGYWEAAKERTPTNPQGKCSPEGGPAQGEECHPDLDRLGLRAQDPGLGYGSETRESEEDKRASGLNWHIKGRRDPPRLQLPGQASRGVGDPQGEAWHRQGQRSWSRLQ